MAHDESFELRWWTSVRQSSLLSFYSNCICVDPDPNFLNMDQSWIWIHKTGCRGQDCQELTVRAAGRKKRLQNDGV